MLAPQKNVYELKRSAKLSSQWCTLCFSRKFKYLYGGYGFDETLSIIEGAFMFVCCNCIRGQVLCPPRCTPLLIQFK